MPHGNVLHTHVLTKVIDENKNYLKKNLPNAINPITNNTQTFPRMNSGHIMHHQYFLILHLSGNMREFQVSLFFMHVFHAVIRRTKS